MDDLVLAKEGMPLQRLRGPHAQRVYEEEWHPLGWSIVEEQQPIADDIEQLFQVLDTNDDG